MRSVRLLARAIKYRYRLNRPEIAFLLEHVRRGDVVMDIGAHKGAYSFWLSKAVGSTGHVYAFEPQAGLAEYTQRSLRELGLRNVTVTSAAMSDAEGRRTLTVRAGGHAHGASLDGLQGENNRTCDVDVVSVDSFVQVRSLERLDFIKCDCEGHEVPVMRGALETLRRFRPIVLVECELRHLRTRPYTFADLVRVFEAAGYEGRFFAPSALRPLSEFDPAVHQVYGQRWYSNNFVFTPAGELRGRARIDVPRRAIRAESLPR